MLRFSCSAYKRAGGETVVELVQLVVEADLAFDGEARRRLFHYILYELMHRTDCLQARLAAFLRHRSQNDGARLLGQDRFSSRAP